MATKIGFRCQIDNITHTGIINYLNINCSVIWLNRKKKSWRRCHYYGIVTARLGYSDVLKIISYIFPWQPDKVVNHDSVDRAVAHQPLDGWFDTHFLTTRWSVPR